MWKDCFRYFKERRKTRSYFELFQSKPPKL